MSIVFAVILGALQGLTEFLPVSSSGHLATAQIFFGDEFAKTSSNFAFDVLVHLATLLVTLCFVWKDILKIIQNIFLKSDEGKHARRLVVLLLVASIPAACVGFGLKEVVQLAFSSIKAVAIGFLITSIVLLVSDRFRVKANIEENNLFNWQLPSVLQALLIGSAQAFAIWPGVSRSGSTIATALILGLPAESALRFSFLLSIPAIIGANILEFNQIVSLDASQTMPFMLGFLTAVAFGFIGMLYLVKLTRASKLRYFSFYTFFLAIFLWLA